MCEICSNNYVQRNRVCHNVFLYFSTHFLSHYLHVILLSFSFPRPFYHASSPMLSGGSNNDKVIINSDIYEHQPLYFGQSAHSMQLLIHGNDYDWTGAA